MIHSMTGYGAAQRTEDGVVYSLELRSLNNRYLKTSVKLPEHLQHAESMIERLVKERLQRGSVTCVLRVRSEQGAEVIPINVSVLQQYADQLCTVRVSEGVAPVLDLGALVDLPGVREPAEDSEDVHAHRLKVIEQLTGEALDVLVRMRSEEGKALYVDLVDGCAAISRELESVEKRAPAVIGEYHERLKQRVSRLMSEGGFELAEEGLMREIAIYAERCDISEEVTRLSSHLDQFSELCAKGEQVGRKLDFLAQELLREANTIASKSNDIQVARSVVEMKSRIDRLKEQVQNVE